MNNLSTRDILVKLIGGEDLLKDNEKDFELVKSADGLDAYDLGEEFNINEVVGYIKSSERLFIISKCADDSIYYAGGWYEVKPGDWMELEAYEYSTHYIDEAEVLEECVKLLKDLFE